MDEVAHWNTNLHIQQVNFPISEGNNEVYEAKYFGKKYNKPNCLPKHAQRDDILIVYFQPV